MKKQENSLSFSHQKEQKFNERKKSTTEPLEEQYEENNLSKAYIAAMKALQDKIKRLEKKLAESEEIIADQAKELNKKSIEFNELRTHLETVSQQDEKLQPLQNQLSFLQSRWEVEMKEKKERDELELLREKKFIDQLEIERKQRLEESIKVKELSQSIYGFNCEIKRLNTILVDKDHLIDGMAKAVELVQSLLEERESELCRLQINKQIDFQYNSSLDQFKQQKNIEPKFN